MKPDLPYKRTDRVGNQILQILGEISTRHINLSRLGFITFTKIDLSPDFRTAKIYFSVVQPQATHDKIQLELNKLRKAFKKYLAPELHLKNIPDIHFYFDETLEYEQKIKVLFNSLHDQSEK